MGSDYCYEDNTNSNILSEYKGEFANNSATTCTETCKDYKFAGMQAGTHCYCGNKLPAVAHQQKGQCTTVCPGNDKEMCGGKSTISLVGRCMLCMPLCLEGLEPLCAICLINCVVVNGELPNLFSVTNQ